jgi:hypothetical protein
VRGFPRWHVASNRYTVYSPELASQQTAALRYFEYVFYSVLVISLGCRPDLRSRKS